jgi:hypothetical protein
MPWQSDNQMDDEDNEDNVGEHDEHDNNGRDGRQATFMVTPSHFKFPQSASALTQHDR